MPAPAGDDDLPPGLRFVLTSLVEARRAADRPVTFVDTGGAERGAVGAGELVGTVIAEVLAVCGLPPLAELPAAYERATKVNDVGSGLFRAYETWKKAKKYYPPNYVKGLPWRALEDVTGANAAPTGVIGTGLKLMLHGRAVILAVVLAVAEDAAGDRTTAAGWAGKASEHFDRYAAVVTGFGQVTDIGVVRSFLLSAFSGKPSECTRVRQANALQISAVYYSRLLDVEEGRFPLINKIRSIPLKAKVEAAELYAARLDILAQQQELYEGLHAELTAAPA